MVCLKLSDFNYDLPKELIAQEPARPRSDSRLMIVNTLHTKNTHHSKTTTESSDSKLADINIKNHINLEHKKFSNIIDYFKKGDVIVINETKVLKALIRGSKSTGAKAQLIITGKRSDGLYICRIATINPHPGAELIFNNGLKAKIIEQKTDIFFVRFNKQNIEKILSKIGELPTPFYITQRLKQDDYYQTVYAKKEGSIAAPTAGLHFTPKLLEQLKKKGVQIVKICLHISFGTFLPVRDEQIKGHEMEAEYYEISEESAEIINNCKNKTNKNIKNNYKGNRLFCVGTTSFKALESASDDKGTILPGNGWSNLFIYPGIKLKTKTDFLITNFHLPKSTLILLVSAFAGKETIIKSYKEAIKKRYRFYSFGDAMLLSRNNQLPEL